MDLTPLLHAAITLAAQAVVGLLTGDWLAGGVLVCFWWFGREHAQAEYRWISAVGTGKRAAMPWWGGFDPRAWNMPSVLDWALPMAAVAGAWALRSHIAALPWQQVAWGLFAALALLQALDVLSTVHVLKRGGQELNPVMRKAMDKLGMLPALLITKAAFLGLVAAGIQYAALPMQWQLLFLIGVSVFYVGIVVHNAGSVKLD